MNFDLQLKRGENISQSHCAPLKHKNFLFLWCLILIISTLDISPNENTKTVPQGNETHMRSQWILCLRAETPGTQVECFGVILPFHHYLCLTSCQHHHLHHQPSVSSSSSSSLIRFTDNLLCSWCDTRYIAHYMHTLIQTLQ